MVSGRSRGIAPRYSGTYRPVGQLSKPASRASAVDGSRYGPWQRGPNFSRATIVLPRTRCLKKSNRSRRFQLDVLHALKSHEFFEQRQRRIGLREFHRVVQIKRDPLPSSRRSGEPVRR